jgi:hypothetical protein
VMVFDRQRADHLVMSGLVGDEIMCDS